MSRVTAVRVRNSNSATASSAECGVIRVVVGLLADDSGRILIGQRRAGTHMAGRWECPGGKRNAGESAFDALRRELHEELAVEVDAAEPLIMLEHQ